MDQTDTGEVQENEAVEPEVTEPQVEEGTTDATVETVEPQPAGDVQTPSNKDEQEGPQEKKDQAGERPKVPVSAQERINRMYARLQKEKSSHATTREKLDSYTTPAAPEAAPETPTYEEPGGEVSPTSNMTTQQFEEMMAARDARKEAERKFQDSETSVLLRHETAINEDGSFNLEDPFTKAYIEVGRENPQLLNMVNGPEIAEAMAEKKLGLGYRKGRQDEAVQLSKAKSAQTGASTTKVSPKQVYGLTDQERKIAHRTGMTEKQYAENKAKIASGNKRVG